MSLDFINYEPAFSITQTHLLLNGGTYTPGGGGGGTWYPNEVPGGVLNGVNTTFTLAHTPTSVVFLFLNGQEIIGGGVDYTQVGKNITMIVPPISTDSLIANYS